jgi:putative endonuclease
MKGGWVYIMTNRPDGTLYTGVTSDIVRRVDEHRNGMTGGFTARYHLHKLCGSSGTTISWRRYK